jgi:hypothetical protein
VVSLKNEKKVVRLFVWWHKQPVGQIINMTCGGSVLVAQADRAENFWQRAIGLLGHKELPPGAGLWITSCGSVHTCGMRFALDLLFLDCDGRVVRVVRGVRPWRFFVAGGASAVSVIELVAGWLPANVLAVGDHLAWQATPVADPRNG